MSSGYRSGNYRNYNSGRYKSGSYSRYSAKQRRFIRLRNRIIIVTCGVVILVLFITLFSLFMKNCVCAGCAKTPQDEIITETIDPSATEAATEATTPAQSLSFITPAVNDNGTDKGEEKSGLYIYNDAAYRAFKGENANAEAYAQVINSAKKKLGKNVNVFSMLVPTHIEMGLPDRLKNSSNGVVTNSQATYIETAYKALNKTVTPINAYNQLAQHCNDYIYFNTDYRWTGLGAYYGYTAFAEATGIAPVTLESMKKKSISGFTGYFESGYDLGLGSDTVEYWSSDDDYDVSIDITRPDGTKAEAYSCFYEAETADTDKVIVFLQGDYPLETIKSTSESAQDKICIVHESFGNPIVSYFTYNYKEVYSIDMSKWTGNLKKFCKQKGIQNVLFINDTASSTDEETLAQITDILG